MSPPRLWPIVTTLGIGQIVSWGALYYSIAVLGASVRSELAVPETVLFGAYSFSLLVSGLAAPVAGRAIDRWGGRLMMSAGSLIAAVALAALALVRDVPGLFIAWTLAGVAMALTLYDPAFATLSQHTGTRYRKALTALTLLGGLASTAAWPASLWGLSALGWRDTLLLFAAVELLVCLPLHLVGIPRLARRGGAPADIPAARNGPAAARSRVERDADRPLPASVASPSKRFVFVALGAAFALVTFVVSAIGIHLVAVLQGKAFSLASAVFIGSIIGPMQVAGRLAEFSVAHRVTPRAVALWSFAGIMVATVLLFLLDGSLALAVTFAVLYGVSNGVVTIARGLLPAELFGREGYGRLLGNLAAPALVARAGAPLACAGLAVPGAAADGWLLALVVLAAIGVLTLAAAVRAPAAAGRRHPA